ncbi:hypothetical protein GCM10027256_33890 [Novispirillum itersonii subsp. nipponicum]|uniref:GIY-YIG domain-containing protein n=1 Tax=Novispirillum itersonii TaxID=189 RepID=A0A7W9ZKB8_NOVIT|nr:hypothetical protein [Novispirillum itersonii]
MDWNSFLRAFTCPAGRSFPDIRTTFSRRRPLDTLSGVPDEPGVYVLIAPNHEFTYPRRAGAVFYIGEAESLSVRLTQHNVHSAATAANARIGYDVYWPIYEYAGAFGAQFSYSTTPDHKAEEGKLLERFARRFGAIPVANTKHSDFWHRVQVDA